MLRMTSCEQDAMDLTQETFIRAYEKLEQFKTSSPFFPWLYTIGMNLARDFHRKVKASKTALEALSADPDSPLNRGECSPAGGESDQVMHLLQTLPPDYREALILRFHQGLSVSELASAVGTSVSGAKMRIHRGLLKLRELLGGNVDGH
jgi:RNA polymerase sigma-70 factor (ECF subfamily)